MRIKFNTESISENLPVTPLPNDVARRVERTEEYLTQLLNEVMNREDT